MRPKTRNKVDCEIDAALNQRIIQFCEEWQQVFGSPISKIEMSKLFGEFGKMDIKVIGEIAMKEGNNGKSHIRIIGHKL